jgi:hypothetical protein
MRDQVHIRNAEAAQLARQTGRRSARSCSTRCGNLARATPVVSIFGAGFCVAIAPA